MSFPGTGRRRRKSAAADVNPGRLAGVYSDYSIGKSEQKAEMSFGGPVPVSAPPVSEVYIPHPHGGTMGSASGRC